jgi:hypothetical protein
LARRWADEAVAATTGSPPLAGADRTRARRDVAGWVRTADRDAHDALALLAGMRAYGGAPVGLEYLAALTVDAGNHCEAARLYGAADAIRQLSGDVRFNTFDAVYQARVIGAA